MRDEYILTADPITADHLDKPCGAIANSSMGKRRYADER